jgi:hypothetical protein
MYCPKCGTLNHDAAVHCHKCQSAMWPVAPSPPRQSADTTENMVIRALIPVGRSGLAIAAGYLGLFALCGIPAPFALALGIVAVLDLKRHPEKHGMGRAIFAIVMGALGTIGLLAFILSGILAGK